ncbi:MAG: peptide chain release factor 3, partial [Clostridia bacterium]
TQLAQEGAIQIFKQKDIGMESFVIGVVGVLQLEVLEYRLLNEYGAKLLMNQLGYTVARWIYTEDKKLLSNIKGLDNGILVYDAENRPVVLVNNEWSLSWILERNPGINFVLAPTEATVI